jgi:hypothetical protein
VRIHHVVLFMLAAPIIGVGLVLWFLLPGSVAGYTYTPSQFNSEATLRPAYWSTHDATVSGYLRDVPCAQAGCPIMVLSDAPRTGRAARAMPDPAHDVELLVQSESGWHGFLRRLLPRFLTKPLTPGADAGKITVTARLVPGLRPGQVPVMRPATL